MARTLSRAASPAAGADAEPSPTDEQAGVGADLRTVAAWTLISRITGFGRVAALAAVLGPTYFGNLFQTSLVVPNIVHELMTGSLITAMLVPPLVKHIDGRDPERVRQLAGGFLGVVLLVVAAVVALSLAAAPLLVWLMSLAVTDPEVREQQRLLGWPLLAMLMPQLFCYSISAIGIAVQHAHRRFALAAAAPALENLGVIGVVGLSALLFGAGTELAEVTRAQLLLLGLGCTAAVGLQAAAQWWGAWRVGVPLRPRFGWRDGEVRRIVHLAIPSGGYACLNGLNFFGLLVVAGSVPGGAIAFQIGLNFFNLPIALFARPVAAAQLPRLSRSFNRGDGVGFHTTYRDSLGLTMMLALPACLVFLAMPEALARAVAFGEMASPTGIALVAACVGSSGLGIVGEAAFVVSTSAAYARRDAAAPFRAMLVRVGLSAAGMALALTAMDGVAVLWTIGLSFSVANLIAASCLQRLQTRGLPPVAGYGLRQLLIDLAIAAAAVAPGMLIARWLATAWAAPHLAIAAAMVAIGVSALLYLAIQWARGSKELAAFLAGRRGPAAPTDPDPAPDGHRNPGPSPTEP